MLALLLLALLLQKSDALKEEWKKLEADKKNAEVTVIPRGTGKYILETFFGQDKTKLRRKRRALQRADSLDMLDNQNDEYTSEQETHVFIPLDAFKDHKYGAPTVDHRTGDLVDVVSLPASFHGSTPPPSPRSLHTLNKHGETVGKRKKKKKKKKDKKQIEEEQKKLRRDNEKFMKQRRLDREQLMLDFSSLNKNIQPRVR